MELEELLSVERAGWEALSRGGGATFYGDLMHPDGVMVLPHGFVFDRDAVVMSSVYTRHDGQWRLVLHQQTPRPGAGG